MAVHTQPEGKFFTGYQGQITSSAIDTRACKDYGYWQYQVSGQSAVLTLEASPDLTGWLEVMRRTATATETGTAQVVGYFPYMRSQIVKAYTGTGGATSGTATVWSNYTPGIGF